MKNIILDNNKPINDLQNNPQGYWKQIPLIVGFSFIFLIIESQHFFMHIDYYRNEQFMLWHSIVTSSLSQLTTWTFFYLITKHKKAALIAFCIGITIVAINMSINQYLSKNAETNQINFDKSILFSLLALTPYLVFGYLTHPKKAVCFLLVAGLLTAPHYSNIDSFINFFVSHSTQESLTYKFYTDSSHISYRPINLLGLFYNFCTRFAIMAAVVALLNELYNYPSKFQDRFLDFRKQHNNFYVFAVAFCSKIYVLSLLIDFGKSLDFYLNSSTLHDKETKFGVPFAILTIALSLIALYVVLWNYRKLLLEWYFERNDRPSFGYWLMQIPILGTAILFFKTLLNQYEVDISQRVTNFNNAKENNYSQIMATFIILFQILLMFLAFVKADIGETDVFSTVFFYGLEIILTLLYFQSIAGYTANAFLSVLSIFVICVIPSPPTSLIRLLFGSLAIQYILLGIFHINHFEYLPSLEEIEKEQLLEDEEDKFLNS